MTNTAPYEVLEERAAEQRRQLHNSVSELRSTVQDTVSELRSTVQDKLDVKKNATQYLGPAAAVAAVLGLMLGYGLTGIFTRD
jgi:type VI protein secretion system component VasF